jgi:phosphatidylglycerophosphate synthase
MAFVQCKPWLWAAGGVAALFLADLLSRLSTAGWFVGVAYLVVSSALLSVGLARAGATGLGAANAITATRSVLVGVVAALTATSFSLPMPSMFLVALAAPALVLDALDGWVARRTHGESALGARFDMEVDAFLLLVLSVYCVQTVGWWVLAIGLLRYAFVAVGWGAPWMRLGLPFRYWRKVVTAVCGIALTLVASGLAPWPVDIGVTAVALALLVESFGRDVIWLARNRPRRPRPARIDVVVAAGARHDTEY